MKQIVILVLTCMTALLNTSGALACSCLRAPIDTEENFRRAVVTSLKQADIVFSGEVIEMDGLIVKFKVGTAWKGDIKDEISMVTGAIRSEDGFILSSMCDYNFEPGKKYLVFANGSEGKLKASKCSWTGILGERERFTNELDRVKQLETESKPGKAIATLDLLRLGRNLTTACTQYLITPPHMYVELRRV